MSLWRIAPVLLLVFTIPLQSHAQVKWNNPAAGAPAPSAAGGFDPNFIGPPTAAQAAGGMTGFSNAADLMCNPVIITDPRCTCGLIPNPNKAPGQPPCIKGENLWMCPPGSCKDTLPGGVVLGICVAPEKCQGTSMTSGLFGSGTPGDTGLMSKLFDGFSAKDALGMLGQLKDMVGGGGGGKGGGSGGGGSIDTSQFNSSGSSGCSSYYPVSSPTTDPCAYYQPTSAQDLFANQPLSITGSSNVSDALNESLGSLLGEGATSGTSEDLTQALSSGSDTSDTDSTGSVGDSILPEEDSGFPGLTVSGSGAEGATSSSATSSANAVALSGTQGNIVLTQRGGTIVANSYDSGANSATAGFYGGDTMSGAPQGLVAGLCTSRPWAGSIVSFVVPPAFFDSLCSLGGYQVGRVAAPAAKTAVPTPKKPAPKPVETAPVATRPATVSIWASPAVVPLGGRTSIFWNSSGATSCIVSSPDGSFNETSLSGGASTVPITGTTVFTISCVAGDGTHATDETTVDIAL